MTWTRPEELKSKLLSRWKAGLYFRSDLLAHAQGSAFPLRVPLPRLSAREVSDHFAEVQAWVIEYQKLPLAADMTLEWRSINHRIVGRNQIPAALQFPHIDALADFLGTRKDLERIRRIAQTVLERLPALQDWIQSHAFDLLSNEPAIPGLLAITSWLLENPRPKLYLRQLSLPGIDTKFLEKHRGILAQWLDIVLPQSAINREHSGGRNFEKRYGFLSKPEVLRFRLLDPSLQIGGFSDLCVPFQEFCRWNPTGVHQVFVTENDVNGLSFPAMPGALVIFGRGYSFTTLKDARWLDDLSLHYWGDLDTHGFAILSEFRGHFPHAESLFMDRETLESHREHWGFEASPRSDDLPALNAEESRLYDDLRYHHFRPNLRLEQEHIRYDWVAAGLSRLGLFHKG